MNFRVRFARGLFLSLLALVGFTNASYAEVKIPALSARVTDLTQTLSAPQQQALEQKLAALETQKGSQIAVLIVPTTAPEEVEQFAIRVAEAWKLGRKGVDDGVLLLVAKEDRTLRIEVGYGLEGAIPDIAAKRIIEETITPRFRAGDFYGGIEQGVDRLIGLINGEPLPLPKATSGRSRNSFGDIFPMALFSIFAVGAVLRLMFGRLLGAGVASAVAGVGGWMLFGGLLGALGAGALAFFLVLFGIGGMGFGGGRGGGGGSSGGGGGGGGGSSGGGGGGSSGGGGGGFSGGGGGGFSGGGGGFGGGGASGRW